MLGGGDWGDKLAAGGKGIGAGLALLTAYRLFVFVCNFLAGRHDARQQRIEHLDAKLQESLAKRLDHLERAEQTNQGRIDLLEAQINDYRKVIIILAEKVRIFAPEDPTLKDIDRVLRSSFPMPRDTQSDMADLLRRMP